MRRKLLGTIAALAAGAGAAWGQTPSRSVAPPPMPIAPAGAVDAIPAPVGGGMGMADGGLFPGGPMPGGPMMGGPMMGGMPGYPPGIHGDPSWQPPFTGGEGPTYESRFAPKLWFNFEHLFMFASAQPTFYPFVTTSAPVNGGVLGGVTTTTLHSPADLGYDVINGFRISTGYFKDDARRYGWYATGFLMENKSNIYTATSDGTGQPVIARPFISAASGAQSALLVSFPNFARGNVTIYNSTRTWGAEVGPVINLFRSCPEDCPLYTVNLLLGFRFLELREFLRMESATSVIAPNTLPFAGTLRAAPSTINVLDEFGVLNQFYGGQAGIQAEARRNRWTFGVTGKIAIGVMHERLDVNGTTTLATGVGPGSTISVAQAGLFANATNIGRINRDEFAVVPEVQGSLGYIWTSWLSTSIGYNFLYASRVIRPGNQYNPNVNPALVPTSPTYGLGGAIPVTPAVLTGSDYWLQGLTFGIHMRY